MGKAISKGLIGFGILISLGMGIFIPNDLDMVFLMLNIVLMFIGFITLIIFSR